MNDLISCPKGCGNKVILSFHDGLNKTIYLNPSGNSEHKCPEPRKWCFGCDANIPLSRPCIHMRTRQVSVTKKNIQNYLQIDEFDIM